MTDMVEKMLHIFDEMLVRAESSQSDEEWEHTFEVVLGCFCEPSGGLFRTRYEDKYKGTSDIEWDIEWEGDFKARHDGRLIDFVRDMVDRDDDNMVLRKRLFEIVEIHEESGIFEIDGERIA